jgi:hypothetical protein
MGASASEIRAGGAFVEVGADTDKAKKNLTGLGSALDQLKKGLGEDSKFGGLFKILAGTGAVAGLALAGRLLSDLTAKAVELSGEFQAGRKSAGDVTEELWQALPVLGNIRKAGLNIRELWDSEAVAVRKITAEAERMNAVVDARRKLLLESNRQWKEQRDIIAGLAGELQLVGKRGLEAQVQSVRNTAADRERGFRRSAADDIKKLEEEAGKSPEAAKDLKQNIAQRRAALVTQISQNAIAAQDQINRLYEEERKRLRDANVEREQAISNIKAQAAATDAQTSATQQLTEAEQAHADRVRESAEIEKELAEQISKARVDAFKDIEGLSSDDEASRRIRLDQLQQEIAAYEDLAAAKQRASAQTAVGAALDSVFSPIEDAFESATTGGGITDRLDAFFGPLEEAYDELKSTIFDTRGGPSFGTFSATEAAGAASPVLGKLTEIAKYNKLQLEWQKRQVGGTFR